MLNSEMFYRIPALLVALVFHEYAHAQMADSLGDRTPRYSGRLTLNPLAHIDPIGLLALWLFRFGWAKPVAVNPYNFSDPRKGMLLTALAGPAMNVFLAFVTLWVVKALRVNLFATGVGNLVYLIIMYNIWLAAFNILPIPPLDGSKVLAGLLPRSQARILGQMEQYGPLLLLALLWLGVIPSIVLPLSRLILGSLHMLAGLFVP